ncbi:MAG: pyridoxamine kinase [Ignavibacteriales bacterium]
MNTPIPKVAAVHDISGFGRAALTVVIPILSTMGIQVCPIPTAVLSTHTGGFGACKIIDLTTHIKEYLEHWSKIGLEFEAVYSGYLGSEQQIEIISDYILKTKNNKRLVVIDPVFGDNGVLYHSINEKMVEKMREYIKLADIITPNFTEAAFLLGKNYDCKIKEQELKEWLVQLSEKGPETVVITSAPDSEHKKGTYVIAYNKRDNCFWTVKYNYMPINFPGTGDIFTSVLLGSILQGNDLPAALNRAVKFVSSAIKASLEYSYPEREGVLLEKVLHSLL